MVKIENSKNIGCICCSNSFDFIKIRDSTDIDELEEIKTFIEIKINQLWREKENKCHEEMTEN